MSVKNLTVDGTHWMHAAVLASLGAAAASTARLMAELRASHHNLTPAPEFTRCWICFCGHDCKAHP